MGKIGFYIIAIVLLSAMTCANARAATYYIDYVHGSDSNNGTSEGTPWKHQPYMYGWTGHYTHQAGDRFIFKGGVEWPYTCFQMKITAGGTATNPDYYGVDKSWYSGSSWSSPIFDGQSEVLPSGINIIQVFEASYITIDNIEIRGLLINSNTPGGQGGSIDVVAPATGITVENCYVHGWNATANETSDGERGGILGANLVDNCTITDADNDTKMSGVAVYGGTVENCKIHDVPTAVLWGGSVHNCLIYNINTPVPDFDSNYHTNVIEDAPSNSGTIYIYDNVIHDTNAGYQVALEPCWAGTSGTIYAFNNVMYNIAGGGGGDIVADSSGGGAGCGAVYIFNNTLQSTDMPSVRYLVRSPGSSYVGTVVVENNHFITDASSPYSFGSGGITPTTAYNPTQTNAQATSQGYTASDSYAPVSGSCSTVGAAGTLTSAGVSALDSDIRGDPRPSTAALKWDAGAYQYQTSGFPAPGGLRIAK